MNTQLSVSKLVKTGPNHCNMTDKIMKLHKLPIVLQNSQYNVVCEYKDLCGSVVKTVVLTTQRLWVQVL